MPIGIYIGDRSIYAVQFSRENGTLNLEAAITEPILQCDEPDDQPRAITKALSRLIATGSFIGSESVSAVPSTDLDVRPISLPPAVTPQDGARFQEALLLEARSCLLYDPAEAMLNYVTLSEKDNGPGRRAAVLLLACRKESANHHVDLLRKAGVQCICLDSSSSAVVRALGSEEQLFSVIELDYEHFVVSMAKGEKLLFSRTIQFGATRFIKAVQRSLDVDVVRAERILKTIGIKHDSHATMDLEEVDEKGAVSPECLPAGIFDICAKELDELASEVMRSLNYFAGLPVGTNVHSILLAGTVFPKGIDAYLEQKLHLPVSLAKPFSILPQDIPESLSKNTAFAQAVGLALREISA